MKKLSVNRHTGPALAVLLLILVTLWVQISFFRASVLGFIVLNGGLLAFFSPWWVAYLWNKFVATEDEYYG